MTNEEKAKELGQKYFPDEYNIWARANIEAQNCTNACLEMAEWKEQQMLTKISDFLNSIGRDQQFGRFERQLKGEDKD